ncbi:hypothetical protein GBF38_016942 [Nibea albiflora]|uniref:Uncharacterized protein n=1 Tax=Nibea albiflora TaxID=240163 RepID=A0ACB7EI72_NIBAL|nr:hypothetical protein GBF38_016942 [Nibea albiflora]
MLLEIFMIRLRLLSRAVFSLNSANQTASMKWIFCTDARVHRTSKSPHFAAPPTSNQKLQLHVPSGQSSLGLKEFQSPSDITPSEPEPRAMTHLAYQPLLPTGNKYLQQKWDTASYELHRGKVKSAKPTINTTPPKTYSHLTLRLKKQKLEEEWVKKTQKENNMLMEKISHIMRTTGGVDNRNDYERKSLGKEKRQLELLRITKENQMILDRLSQCRPHYNVRSWHEDWLKTLKEHVKDTKKCSDQDQKISTDATTHKPESNKASGKETTEGNEEGREPSEKEGTGTEIQQNTATSAAPEPDVPEKSVSPGPPENPAADKTSNTNEAFLTSHGESETNTVTHDTASPAEK